MLRSLRSRVKRSNEPRVLILGLDNAGKTTIINTLGKAEVKSVEAPEGPTQGFNIMNVVRNDRMAKLCDLGGQRALRQYWEDYYDNTDCIMFVVDSSDQRRIQEAYDTFESVLQSLPKLPTLVMANKQDLATAKDPATISELLHLNEHRERQWSLQGCSAKTGYGLNEGMDWIFSVCL